MPTVVSFFSGCGGLDLGFKNQGFDIIYACDNDPAAVDCYARNIDPRVRLCDVTSNQFHSDIRSLGNCDVVLGGFPCQGFSKAGPKRENDTRNDLYIEMLRAIKILQPRLFIAENVDGLSQNFNGFYLQQIIEDFAAIDYKVTYRIIDAIAYGLPQHRRRIFFVGIRSTETSSFTWPNPTHFLKARDGEFKINEEQPPMFELLFSDNITPKSSNLLPIVTIRDVIADLEELDNSVPDHAVVTSWPKKYEVIFRAIGPGQKLCNVRHSPTSVYTWDIPEVFGSVSQRQYLILDTISRHRRHKRYGSIPNGNPLPINEIERLAGLNNISPDIDDLMKKDYLKQIDGKYDLKGAMFCSGIFKRPLWNEPSPTVLTNFYNPRYFLHPRQNRPFSLRECARLQGFPDNFIFVDQKVDLVTGYRLVGNAVPPPVSQAFAVTVRNFITLSEQEVILS